MSLEAALQLAPLRVGDAQYVGRRDDLGPEPSNVGELVRRGEILKAKRRVRESLCHVMSVPAAPRLSKWSRTTNQSPCHMAGLLGDDDSDVVLKSARWQARGMYLSAGAHPKRLLHSECAPWQPATGQAMGLAVASTLGYGASARPVGQRSGLRRWAARPSRRPEPSRGCHAQRSRHEPDAGGRLRGTRWD